MKLVESNIKPIYVNSFTNMIYQHFMNIAHIAELSHTRKDIKNILESEELKLLLLFNNESVLVGYLVSQIKLVHDGRFVLYISYIYIKPEYRRNGFGETMIKYFVQFCKKNDIKFIMLTFDANDKKLVKFYNKLGFQKDEFIDTNFKGNQVFTLSL